MTEQELKEKQIKIQKMSIEEYYAVQIDDIVYNKETLEIAKFINGW